jgi:arylsulfatase A-like enzyme
LKQLNNRFSGLARPRSYFRGLFNWLKRHAPSLPGDVVPWRQVTVNTLLTAFLYVLMEWFFFVTKSSFMDRLSLGDKLAIPLLTGLMASLPAMLALLLVYLLNLFLGSRLRWFNIYCRHLPAALLAACLGLVMVDNFTYTVLDFGIVDAKSAIRLVYVLLIVVFLILGLHNFAKGKYQPRNVYPAAALFVLSLGLAFFTLQSEQSQRTQTLAAGEMSSQPNVILISTDGLSADNMSVYGYKRETTPFLSELAETSLVGQDNFTNSGHSLGSEASMLTSKLPLETGVLYPPDILVGIDKYQHLPGILKQNGYRSVELGVKYYVDANQVNFQNAFDAVNCEENSDRGVLDLIASYGYDNAVYMFDTITSRIKDRLDHIFFIKDMINSFSMVTENDQTQLSDSERLICLQNYLQDSAQSGQPLFAHLHLMGTHGPKFEPSNRQFSEGEKQSAKWMTDFYDDSILDFDGDVQDLVTFLKEIGQYDNTILVVYTDHGMGWSTLRRIPLIIHFPNDEHAGKVTQATQNLDIAPTILDYLGLDVPQWMNGSSMLGELDPTRLLISGRTNMAVFADELFMVDEDKRQPPFYQFTELDVIQCQRYYRINLEDLTITRGLVHNYINPCPASQLDSQSEIRQQVGELLSELGYDLPADW